MLPMNGWVFYLTGSGMPTYSKRYLKPQDQVALLKSRGLQITDESFAVAALTRNGYYRLSAYWLPFREFLAVFVQITSLKVAVLKIL